MQNLLFVECLYSVYSQVQPCTHLSSLDLSCTMSSCSFEFLYKQAVSTTDAFLGMMDKDASSACCEDVELRIDLPKAKGLSGSCTVLLLTGKHCAI